MYSEGFLYFRGFYLGIWDNLFSGYRDVACMSGFYYFSLGVFCVAFWPARPNFYVVGALALMATTVFAMSKVRFPCWLAASVVVGILLSWYYPDDNIQPGQQLTANVQLKRLRGAVNPNGFATGYKNSLGHR